MRKKRFLVTVVGVLLTVALSAKVAVGIDVLRGRNFDILKGKRVGLLTNPTGVDSNLVSTVDILHQAKNVDLVCLFAPEHGVRGNFLAGKSVADEKDAVTGLPVYSLHGSKRQATAEMLKGLDAVVYDIQDVGLRSYTFISCLGLMMRTCAETGVEMIILDRPNPLGGNKIEGSYVEKGYFSYVSQYRIPYVYGLTVGELATLINEEGLNCGMSGNLPHKKCKLTVVPMSGWTRSMTYAETGLHWVPTSPCISDWEYAIYCASSGIMGEISNFMSIGVGYYLPFRVFAADWVDPNKLKAELDSYHIPGLIFRVVYFTPFANQGKGILQKGVQFFYSDYNVATITLTQFYVFKAIMKLYPTHNPFMVEDVKRFSMFDKVCGTNQIRSMLIKNASVADIQKYWSKDLSHFSAIKKKYHLYK